LKLSKLTSSTLNLRVFMETHRSSKLHMVHLRITYMYILENIFVEAYLKHINLLKNIHCCLICLDDGAVHSAILDRIPVYDNSPNLVYPAEGDIQPSLLTKVNISKFIYIFERFWCSFLVQCYLHGALAPRSSIGGDGSSSSRQPVAQSSYLAGSSSSGSSSDEEEGDVCTLVRDLDVACQDTTH
jgi:hypothetical protein